MPPDTPGPEPQIEIQSPHAGLMIVALRGEHDLSTKAELAAALASACASAPLVVVDLGECSFIDSTVIASILSSYARAGEQGCRLALVIPQTDGIVARTAELSGLRALVPTFSSLEEAL
jgi:anti-anti-sigma factor